MIQEKKPTLGFVVTVVIVAVLVAPVFYVLSAGPAQFLSGMGVISEETVFMAYAPLNFIVDYIPERVASWYEDYLDWWEALGEATGLPSEGDDPLSPNTRAHADVES
jgi:hypothetical protein